MMPPLIVHQRRQLLRLSAAMCGAALLLLPLGMQASVAVMPGEARDPLAAPVPTIPPPLTFPQVVVRRDPFATESVSGSTDGLEDASLAGDISLPPNEGAGEVPSLRAILLGASPRALVQIGDRVAVVTVGSVLAGLRVVSIQANSLLLDDGERLTLENAR